MKAACAMLNRLPSFLSGTLSAADESAIEDHVDSCPECQRQLNELTEDTVFDDRLSSAIATADHLNPVLRHRISDASQDLFVTRNGTADVEDTHPDRQTRGSSDDWPVVPGYNVLECLGRGGVGVVYRAFDVRLMRPVALKIIRHQAGPEDRERLQREAQALAALQHPNIVRIFEIGECNGRPYLALEFVPNGNLLKFCSGVPQPAIASARLVKLLADAVQAAHRRGLVHRDLKPANILLDWPDGVSRESDITGAIPRITDFGLVKDISTDSKLTHSRDLLGTPSFMAPEQAGSDATKIGPPCDIWALGAILYELLTGRPPFHGPTAVDTLMQVRQSEPVAPSRLQPHLPRDLETICLKCLQKSPDQRYPTAGELAEDLQRFVESRPISARPISLLGKSWRWCKRNPTTAGLCTAVALLVAALAVAGPVVAVREAGLRRLATDQANRAERNFELASHALDATLQQVYTSIGMRPDAVTTLDAKASQATVPFLEELVQQPATTPASKLQRINGLRQLARSMTELRQFPRAEALLNESLDEMKKLEANSPNKLENQRQLALCHFELGRFLLRNPVRLVDAQAQIDTAIRAQEALCAAHPNESKYCEELANSYFLIGDQLGKLRDRWADAKAYLSKAYELRRGLTASSPNDRAYLFNEATTAMDFGRVLNDLSENDEAVAVYRRALEVQKKRVAMDPADPQMLYVLATLELGLGFGLTRLERWDEVHEHMTASIDIHDKLAEVFPTVHHYAQPAAQAHDVFRYCYALQQNWPAAIEQVEKALAITERYIKANLDSRPAQVDLQIERRNYGDALRRVGRKTEAAVQIEQAIALGKSLLSASEDTRLRRSYADAHNVKGELLFDEGETRTALEQFDTALQLLGAPDKDPHAKDLRAYLARAHRGRAKALSSLGRGDEAREAESQAAQFSSTN